jgi:cell division protein FtsB
VQRSWWRRWPQALFAALVVYFAGHGLAGEQGLIAWRATEAAIAAEEARLAALDLEVADLERRADRLRDGSLDLDYLDERARAVAHVAHPRDIVVPGAPPSSP